MTEYVSHSPSPPRTRLRCYQPNILQELLADSLRLPEAASDSTGQKEAQYEGQHPDSSQGSSLWERAQAQRQAKEAIRKAKEAAFLAATRARQQAAEAEKDAAFQSDYESILAGMGLEGYQGPAEASHIMTETQHVLEHKQKIKDKKQAALYDEWSTEVFDKIQGRLQTAVGRRTDKEVLKRLKHQMDEYLHTTNTKLGVFRDVIIEDDYNPLKAHETDIKIYTGDIRDPVKRDVLKIQYERALMGASSTQDDMAAGKTTLDTKMWGDLWIHATPYGHLVDESGNNVLVTMSDRAVAARKSRVPMDHYDFPVNDNQAAAVELGRPGKRSGIQITHGRKDLYDVVQQTCHLNPQVTGGDSWLEAKGKGSAPGPEKRRGRTDLTEVLHQSSNPYKDGRTLGDQWLEAKGKAMPPGPEQRRGRVDLTDTIQQRPLPPPDHRPHTVGDQWLDARGKGAAVPTTKETVREFLFRADHPPDPAKVKDPRRYLSVMVNDKTLHPRV